MEKLQSENKFSKQALEYSQLLLDNYVADGNVEVFVDNNNVHIVVLLDVDFSDLPPYIQP